MSAGRILGVQFVAAFLLALLTWIAIWQSLYWRLWWFDIPMHILGGVWAGLCAAWLTARREEGFSLLWCLVFTLAIGIGWELFEYSEGIAFPRYFSYPADTIKDLVMDLVGGALGWFLATKLLPSHKIKG